MIFIFSFIYGRLRLVMISCYLDKCLFETIIMFKRKNKSLWAGRNRTAMKSVIRVVCRMCDSPSLPPPAAQHSAVFGGAREHTRRVVRGWLL